MKKFLLVLFAMSTIAATAQMKEGRVVYERVFQMPTRNFGNIDPAIAAQIPKSRTDQFELLFGKNQSLWQILPSLNSDDQSTFASGGVMIRMNAPGSNEIAFHDFDKGTRVVQQEVMDQGFVVSDSIRKLNWKLSDETKTILNYTAHKATAQRISVRSRMTMENGEMKRQDFPDTAQVVAWYTTEIPVPAGPEFQGQLPGLVLELDIDKGQTVYKAIEISPKVNTSKIKEPKEGKKVTAAEFDKQRAIIMEQMRKNMPAGNSFRIQQ